MCSPALWYEAPADLSRDKAHFPFLKLPAEIRNMVYKLALVTDSWIMLSDMYPPDFECLQASHHPLRRTPYIMNAHDAGYCEAVSVEPNMRTTYEYEWCHCGGRTHVTPLLSVCRQVNTEAVPILYGMNKFAFCSAQAIVPFLQDRPLTSQAQIKRIRLCFIVETEDAQRRHKVWSSTLNYVGQRLRLETLDLVVYLFDKCSMAEIEQRAPKMQWVQSLISINKLTTLNVKVDFAEPEIYSHRRMKSDAEFMLEFVAYLESKMLKSKAAASNAQV